jgi:hypothetical protein
MEAQMRTLVRSLCLATALGAVPFAGAAIDNA